MIGVTSLASMINLLNAVAMGDKKADIILKNCSLVNVYTREINKNIQVAIIKDRIAYVGPDATHTTGNKTTIIDLEGKYLTPGFADPHVHIDQFVFHQSLQNNPYFVELLVFFPILLIL